MYNPTESDNTDSTNANVVFSYETQSYTPRKYVSGDDFNVIEYIGPHYYTVFKFNDSKIVYIKNYQIVYSGPYSKEDLTQIVDFEQKELILDEHLEKLPQMLDAWDEKFKELFDFGEDREDMKYLQNLLNNQNNDTEDQSGHCLGCLLFLIILAALGHGLWCLGTSIIHYIIGLFS